METYPCHRPGNQVELIWTHRHVSFERASNRLPYAKNSFHAKKFKPIIWSQINEKYYFSLCTFCIVVETQGHSKIRWVLLGESEISHVQKPWYLVLRKMLCAAFILHLYLLYIGCNEETVLDSCSSSSNVYHFCSFLLLGVKYVWRHVWSVRTAGPLGSSGAVPWIISVQCWQNIYWFIFSL